MRRSLPLVALAAAALLAAAVSIPARAQSALIGSGALTGTTGAAHAAGSAICGNPCAAITISFGRGGLPASVAGRLTGFRVRTNSVSITNLLPRVELFSAPPTLTGINDAGAYSPVWADRGISLGYVECATAKINADNTVFSCSFPTSPGGNLLDISTDNLAQIYAVLLQSPAAGGSYTPANGQLWDLRAVGSQE